MTLPRVTLRRVTLPRAVARSLHTTPARHIAPAPQAAGQAGASPEDMGSVTNVSRSARARPLPRVLGMTTLLDLQPARPNLSLVHSAPLRPRDRERGGRRLFNFIVAVVGLVLTFPLMLLIAALIKLTSRGPVLFTQTRVGLDRRALSNAGGNTRRHTDQGGAPFTMYKFRTMRHANGNGKQVWAQADDVRVTPIGRVLRKLRLDELPQLFNVLKGEMNIVGPRPERPSIFMQLRKEIDRYHLRQRAKPGITGWAQINQNYDTSIDDVRRKVEFDLAYIERRSVVEDMRIMAKTLPVMIFRKGAH